MRYPEKLIDKIDHVREIHESWKSPISFDDVVKWILQFDTEDYDLAIRIIEHINFLNFGDIKSALAIAYSKLIRKSIDKGTKITNTNTLFAGIGENGKSGSMISYHFRVVNELSEENFADNDELIEKGKIENIVLIDDIISTGHQASKEIKQLTEKVTPFGVKNIFLLTVCGMREAIIKIEDETKAYTFSAIEYSTKDTVIDLDGRFYNGLAYEEREKLKSRIEYYGKVANPKQPFGFGQIGGLIAFDFNTPNTSLPIIWSDSNSWIPIFKRARRINGISSYYKQFEKIKKNIDNEDLKKNIELSIYVEGKTEEMLFDLLIREKNFAEELGYSKVNVISLGGMFGSKSLINKLQSDKQDSIFILENDVQTKDFIKKSNMQDSKIVYLSPNVMGFFNIRDLIFSQNDRQLIDLTQGYDITDKTYFDAEMILVRKASLARRQNLLINFIDKFFNTDRYNQFIREIKEKLN